MREKSFAEYRLRGIPAPLWRRVRRKAGDDIQRVLLGLLNAYADGHIDPLTASESNPVAAGFGKLGGQARARNLTPEQRSAIARKARAARTDIGHSAAPRPDETPLYDTTGVRLTECELCHVAPTVGTYNGRQVCASCIGAALKLEPAHGGDLS